MASDRGAVVVWLTMDLGLQQPWMDSGHLTSDLFSPSVESVLSLAVRMRVQVQWLTVNECIRLLLIDSVNRLSRLNWVRVRRRDRRREEIATILLNRLEYPSPFLFCSLSFSVASFFLCLSVCLCISLSFSFFCALSFNWSAHSLRCQEPKTQLNETCTGCSCSGLINNHGVLIAAVY